MNPNRIVIMAILLVVGMAVAVSIYFTTVDTDADTDADTAASGENGEPELAEAMSRMQYYTHKLTLSVEAENAELTGFYIHEMEELADEIVGDIPEYEGHEIGRLVESMLVPEIEALEERIDGDDWAEASASIDDLILSCNNCHTATDHGFVVIERPADNPFMQSFTGGTR